MWQVDVCKEICDFVEICKVNELQGQDKVKKLIVKIRGYISIPNILFESTSSEDKLVACLNKGAVGTSSRGIRDFQAWKSSPFPGALEKES